MRDKKYSIDLIFILTLFLLFAITSIATVIVGIKIYRSSTNTMDANYETRTLSSYLTEKVRAYDSYDSIHLSRKVSSLDSSNTGDILVLSSTVDDKQYITYIYVYESYVRELTISSDSNVAFNPNSGQKVMAARELSFTKISDHVLDISYISPAGNPNSFKLYTHSRLGGML